MKHCYLVSIVIVGSLLGLALLRAEADPPEPDGPPEAVIRAAEKAAPHWLGLIQQSPPEHFGFTNPNQVERAELGEPHEVYTIEPDGLQEYDASMAVSMMLSKADCWLFPVLIDGKAQFFYEIALLDGKWQPVSIGGDARDIEQIYSHIPTLLQAKRTSENSVKFVRVYHFYEFILVDTLQGEFIVLPEWSARYWGMPERDLIDPKMFMPKLAREVQWKVTHPGYDGGHAGAGDETLDSHANEAERPARRTPNPATVAWGGAGLLTIFLIAVAVRHHGENNAPH
jgi:hypothetical protein